MAFNFYYDRDCLINESPRLFGNVSISFVVHENAWKCKRVTMNDEIWLMFLSFNVYHWNDPLVDKALADWDRLVNREEDPSHLSRIIVKAKVFSLEEIPWFLFCFETDDFEGHTWIIQCEILQSRMLGALPAADEDVTPEDTDNLNPHLFISLVMVN